MLFFVFVNVFLSFVQGSIDHMTVQSFVQGSSFVLGKVHHQFKMCDLS